MQAAQDGSNLFCQRLVPGLIQAYELMQSVFFTFEAPFFNSRTQLTSYNIMEGVTAVMEAPQRDKIPKLWWVIQELKGMDSSWREDSSAPPTAEEEALYQLLVVHVNSEFSLLHREKHHWLLNPSEYKVECAIKVLRDWKNACIEPSTCIGFKDKESNESEEGNESDSDYDVFDAELGNTSAPLELLIRLLVECRHSVAKQSLLEECTQSVAKLKLPGRLIPDAMNTSDREIQGGESQNAILTPPAAECCAEAMMEDELLDDKEEETRADTLRNVLYCLEHMRRERAYAPPKADELEYYREIRKLITSTYMYFLGKAAWQDTCKRPAWLKRCSMSNSERCFAQMIPRICNGNWINIRQIDTYINLFRTPEGHVLERAFDEIPITKSLLINCKRKLSDSLEGLSLEKINWMGTVKYPFNGVKACSGKGVRGKHLRDKLLNSVLKAFRRMKSLSSTRAPTYREVRLFDRIAEHVVATAVVFYSLEASEDSQPYRGSLFEVIPRNLDKLDRKMESRAAYLEQIMLAVETIKSLYGSTPPTKSQMRIYNAIRCHVRKASKQFYGKKQVHLSADDIIVAREVREIIYKREMDCLCGLMDEYKEMLHMIFTTVPRGFNAVDTFRLLEARKDSAVEELKLRVMVSPRGPEILERALLTLQEAYAIHDELYSKFFLGNVEVNLMISDETNYGVLLEELWTGAGIKQFLYEVSERS